MSLFLRKACQDLLDGVDLNNYHIQVDEASKTLQIVGECGQVLTSIAGIRLSRMAPAKDEIALALELFDAFLAKHGATFKEFIAVTKEAATVKKPELPDLLECRYTNSYGTDHERIAFNLANRRSLSTHHSVCEVTSEGMVSVTSANMNIVLTPDDANILSAPTLTIAELKAVKEWISGMTAFRTIVARKEELLEKLTTCEV